MTDVVESVGKVKLVDRRRAFLSRHVVTEPLEKDPIVDSLECEGYHVEVAELITCVVTGNFFNLTIYTLGQGNEYHEVSFVGNDSIEMETVRITRSPD